MVEAAVRVVQVVQAGLEARVASHLQRRKQFLGLLGGDCAFLNQLEDTGFLFHDGLLERFYKTFQRYCYKF
jgi:hypothetical protein